MDMSTQPNFLISITQKALKIFAHLAPFTKDDYEYLSSYLTLKTEELIKGPWVSYNTKGKDLEVEFKEILIVILQALSLTKELLTAKSSDKEYAENLEKLEDVDYLSKKSLNSNLNSPQCIYYNCKDITTTQLIPCEELPFKVELRPFDSTDYEKEEGNKEVIKINYNLAQVTVASLGRILIYFNAYVTVQVVKTLCALAEKSFTGILDSCPKFKGMYKLAKELNKLHSSLDSNIFSKETFRNYESAFADKISKKTQVMLNLQRYLFYAQIQQDKKSLHYLEKLLIQLLGHYDFEVRDQSIIYLNMLYDGVDWQYGEAFDPKVTCVRSQFLIDENIISKTRPNYVLLLLSAPAFCRNCVETIITWHPLEIVSIKSSKGEYRVKAKFKKFWRCGFYDWKLMEIDSEGKIAMLKKLDSEGMETFAQGRFIVHPEGVTEQQIHEIMVDYKDQDTDPDKNFFTLAQEIPDYAKEGINCLYLMGALERDNGTVIDRKTGAVLEVKRPEASPLAITDLSVVNKMIGGEKGCQIAMKAARDSRMRILIDCMARVSSTRPHHKYKRLLLHTLDEKGRSTLCYGTDGRSVNYEDTAILNYRKLSSWNIIINDTLRIAEKYKIDGIHIDNAQTWPVILELDEEELYRQDPDGTPAYTNKQILDGEMVKQCEGQGYWDSDSLVKYPNPIFIKICRELWKRFPDFLIIGECLGGSSLENRQGILARSGVIPRLFKLPIALAAIFGKKLLRSGQVIGCKPETVNTIKNWYETNRKFTPEGSYLIQSSSSHIWPYPALLYGRGAWSAVDVLFFMPDIPMTFMGEIYGHAYRRNVTSVYQAKPLPRQHLKRPKSQLHLEMEGQEDTTNEKTEEHPEEKKGLIRVRSMVSLSALKSTNEKKAKEEEVNKQLGPQFGFDLNKIHIHYEQRRKLRKERPVLRFGEMIMLEAKHSEGTHPYVLTFARFSPSETAVIATNFTDRNVSFYIDLKNLLPMMQKHYPPNIVVLFSDWLLDGDKEYYFLNELIHEKIPMTLKPFSSLCSGIVICSNDPYAYAVALEKSAIRLNSKIIKGFDCSSAQLLQQLNNTLANYGSLDNFAMHLIAIMKLYAESNKLDIQKILLNSFGYSNETKTAGLCIEYCKRIIECKAKNPKITNSMAYKASKEIIKNNELGAIVFITPEIGRWSTVGGLGVMVDELTQGLAEINEDVYLIAVYYDKNRKGESGYLAKDPAGFKYVKNITVKTPESEHTLGVHVGIVNKVKLIFLHHAGLFPSPYPDWNAAMTLRQIVVFCKGALEYLCSEELIPALIVTNDWFTGLTAAYGKYGAFGNVFKGTTFLHIFHNLQEAYEGRLYPDPRDGDLSYIHSLDMNLLVDPYWGVRVFNPSRCATIASDQWATVSKSYKDELLATSALAPLLSRHQKPFAFQNGIPIQARLNKMKEQVGTDHYEAKKKLQQKYFRLQNIDYDIPVFAFVGRITSQKGVHLICEAAEHLINKHQGKINILVGGPANRKEPYAARCANNMEYFARKYPNSFWAAPNEFFTDGALVNLGADFGMMPSAFEPGGIVQHEFFVGGTPVIAYKTGGLKDSVHEYNWDKKEGNGFIFQSYNRGDFIYAVERAIMVFKDKENYKILRKNAFESTMDGATVTKEWCKEFYRLRGKFFGDTCTKEDLEQIPTEWNYDKYNDSYLDEYLYRSFIKVEANHEAVKLQPLLELAKKQSDTKTAMFKISLGTQRANNVQLCGSFDDWKVKYNMSYDQVTNIWYIVMHLKKGKYNYKYIVDDIWMCNDSERREKDNSGTINNVIDIV